MTGVRPMTNTKSLMLAAVAALSLGLGSAMAQESVGGAAAGRFVRFRSVPRAGLSSAADADWRRRQRLSHPLVRQSSGPAFAPALRVYGVRETRERHSRSLMAPRRIE